MTRGDPIKHSLTVGEGLAPAASYKSLLLREKGDRASGG